MFEQLLKEKSNDSYDVEEIKKEFIEKQKKRGAAGGKSRSGQFDIARQKCFDLYMQNPSLKVAEIAKECCVSERTIRNYLKSIKKQKRRANQSKNKINHLFCELEHFGKSVAILGGGGGKLWRTDSERSKTRRKIGARQQIAG